MASSGVLEIALLKKARDGIISPTEAGLGEASSKSFTVKKGTVNLLGQGVPHTFPKHHGAAFAVSSDVRDFRDDRPPKNVHTDSLLLAVGQQTLLFCRTTSHKKT